MEKLKNLIILTFFVSCSFNSLSAQNKTFTLKSDDVGGQFTKEQVYNKYGCQGQNISPQLHWENAPENTKSYAVTIYDPDAPTGSGWWHWLIFNIPNTVNEIPKNAGNPQSKLIPSATQSINDYGTYGYGGPCPPQRDKPHRYIITVYALNVEKLKLDNDTNPATVSFYLNNHSIAKASLLVFYGR